MIDARSLPDNHTLETDICIVGAGVAGITLARELVSANFRVCLLESGGLEPDRNTQSLYWGENIGQPYYSLDTCRGRLFGGTSHYWIIPLGEGKKGVRLRPLDPIDFEQRDWVPYSGWPFDKTHLDPFYERAQSVCRIGPFRYDAKFWSDPAKTPELPLSQESVKTSVFQFGERDCFFTDYRNEIDQARNISTYIYANAVEIETADTPNTVSRLHIACLGGKKLSVTAKIYVLAMGAIEIPRLLLLSNRTLNTGLANQNDLVGRFFMEHPHLWSGIYMPASPEVFRSVGLYRIHRVANVPIMGKLAITEDAMRNGKLLNWCASIHPSRRGAPAKGVESLKSIISEFKKGRLPDELLHHLLAATQDIRGISTKVLALLGKQNKDMAFRLNHMAEQTPNPDSRITLSAEPDELGQRRVNLDWRLTAQDMQSMVKSQEIVDQELRRAGLGRLHIEQTGDRPPQDIHGGWHHMGTTRMHVNPGQGVVDANSKVHGISNLYVAGPSVFPTGGCSNPVLTIVALTIRLADHLKNQMLKPGF